MDTITGKLSVVSGQLSVADDETLTESGFYWREQGGVKVLVSSALENAGFANGFSTRLGGVSSLDGGQGNTESAENHPVAETATPLLDKEGSGDLNLAGFNEDSAENIYENRRRFLAVFEKPYQLATAWQVHGDAIKVVGKTEDIRETDQLFDALISDLPNVLVGVKTADCVPVLIGDRVTGAFAAVHAGWRGTAQGIVAKAVAKMNEVFGTLAADLVCAIGPAAGCERYEVGRDVIDLFEKNFSAGGKYFTETRPGHALVDLKLANCDQLIDLGVGQENISIAQFCTMTRSDLFFSYRIEKKQFGKTGRLLSVIGRR